MDALIFYFDGVVVDSESIHLMGFQEVLRTVGVSLAHDEYYRTYLGYNDHDCLLIAARAHGVHLDESKIAELTAAKDVPLAVCSGALRDEIVLASRTIGVLEHFTTIVSAEDVQRGKPDPEGI